MSYVDQKHKLKDRADQLDAIAKPLRNVTWIGALALAAWVQFLGPGLSTALRELSGSNDIFKQMEVGFGKTNSRLDFIEQNITPPKVANWNFHRQLDTCSHSDCRVLHNISRTSYGETCGVPVTTVLIRSGENGQEYDMPLGEGFREQAATRQGRNFIIPFQIPDILRPGNHKYQFKNVYPTCEWIREPIPRYSQWFDIEIMD